MRQWKKRKKKMEQMKQEYENYYKHDRLLRDWISTRHDRLLLLLDACAYLYNCFATKEAPSLFIGEALPGVQCLSAFGFLVVSRQVTSEEHFKDKDSKPLKEMERRKRDELICIFCLAVGTMCLINGYDTQAFIVESVLHSVHKREPGRIDKHAGYYGIVLGGVVLIIIFYIRKQISTESESLIEHVELDYRNFSTAEIYVVYGALLCFTLFSNIIFALMPVRKTTDSEMEAVEKLTLRTQLGDFGKLYIRRREKTGMIIDPYAWARTNVLIMFTFKSLSAIGFFIVSRQVTSEELPKEKDCKAVKIYPVESGCA
ncbi:hypothetical protein TELCIR_05443 [Teladorsagia circumcincta]|uniref:Uncharacterized protein n=1 Tax=Teladorsagia circumcincta TaxID=45464 RepID=A0A2G9UQS3_TELCI|nr:hypothetical protein TELCIR_05443 [Teladorsagia circumcincta]